MPLPMNDFMLLLLLGALLVLLLADAWVKHRGGGLGENDNDQGDK